MMSAYAAAGLNDAGGGVRPSVLRTGNIGCLSGQTSTMVKNE
ncbi:hypothetical protein ACZ87_01321 [Candidatus Erwinia dacicola]|uniref:Uncharacterized protein n=1 Tax=Candidatus Erwinia dacicola TaxID=252393 RepID=A0A328TVM1_9GAMM|nr:hypothetical protein ACZ87_01321 [Candidatus Erwinia dacicola]